MKWLPLPKIAHAVAVYPYTPPSLQQSAQLTAPSSRPLTQYSTIQSPLLSPHSPLNDTASIYSVSSAQENSSADPADYACLLPLEVGDELFILEQLGQWYRGYVLSTLEEGRIPNVAPIGCFPRSHVQIKEYVDLDPNETDAALVLRRTETPADTSTAPWASLPEPPSLARSLSESHIHSPHSPHSSHSSRMPPPSPRGLSARRRPDSVAAVIEEGEDENEEEERSPAIQAPSLLLARFDQSTLTGSSEPLVDETGACASDWYCMLYKYLEEGRYTAFNAVRDHINYLLQARRQLLDQALSKEELLRLRKEIVHRMVVLNLSQNKEMILRHPERGYILDANSTSLATLYRIHWKYALADHVPVTSYSSAPPALKPSVGPTSTITPTTSTEHPQISVVNPQQQPQPQHQHPQQQSSHSTPNATKGGKFHHLFFELKACVAHICQPGEFTELYFSLYNKANDCTVTEQFSVTLTYNGMPKDERQIGRLRTLFADLSPHDVSEHLYLVCRIVRLGSMKFSDKEKDHLGVLGSHASMLFGGGGGDSKMLSYFDQSGSSRTRQASHSSQHPRSTSAPNPNICRRPFGCAVLHLGSLLQKEAQSPSGGTADMLSPTGSATSGGSSSGSNGASGATTAAHHALPPTELDIPIYTASTDSAFATLHEDIINNNTKDIGKHARAETLCIYLRMFYGQLVDVLRSNASLLQEVPRTLRLGFPDVVFPDDERNDLYLTLCTGDFVQFGRSRNIQVAACVRDNVTGDIVEDALSAGAGAPLMTYWESMVLYHEQRPKWNEVFKLKIRDPQLWERSHLFLTVRHRSSSGTPETSHSNSSSTTLSATGQATTALSSSHDKILAMGFIPLFLPPQHRYFIADGSHTLTLYKYDRQLAHPRVYLENVPWCSRSSAPFNTQPPLLKRSNTFSSASLHSLSSDASSWTESSVSAAVGKLVTVKDTLTLKTLLCSTQFTQNETLVRLLNWRSTFDGNHEELLAVLDKFTFVGEMEVVKFLNDIFDALLAILVHRHPSEEVQNLLCDEAIAAIVWVLGIVQDRRFSNFRPVLDVYVEQRFSLEDIPTSGKRSRQPSRSEAVHDQLLKGLARLCSNPDDPRKAKRLRTSTKVWEYLFRFIVRSRSAQQHKEDEGERGLRDIMFKEELDNVLYLITQMMGPDQPSVMIGTQTLALQHFADILVELRRVYSPKELVDITRNFVDASAHATGKLIGHRLCMILAIVKSPVFNDNTCRAGLAKEVFRWVQVWVNSYMAAAKNVIFSRQNEHHHDGDHHQQMRLPRVQWLEYLRLSLTIIMEVLDKVRRFTGMASLGLSSSVISSPSIMAFSRPISMATSTDEEPIDESRTETQTITEVAILLVPQLLNAYKDLQRLTIQAIHASGMAAAERTSATASSTTHGTNSGGGSHASMGGGGSPTVGPIRSNTRNSLSVLRDRSNSLSLKHSPSVTSTSSSSGGGLDRNGGGSRFSAVLQSLATSPTTPFPSTYPFQPTSIKSNPALAATGNLAAMVTTGLLDITVVLLELFHLTPRQQWVSFLVQKYEKEGVDHLAAFLRQLSHACMAILFGDSMHHLDDVNPRRAHDSEEDKDDTTSTRKIPETWLNLDVIAHQIVLTNIMEPVVDILEMPKLSSHEDVMPDSVHDLWCTFFVSTLRVLSSSCLDLEAAMPQVQRAVWKLIGNLKGEVGANMLLHLWHLTGSQQERDKIEGLVRRNSVMAAAAAAMAAATATDTKEGSNTPEEFLSAEEGDEEPKDRNNVDSGVVLNGGGDPDMIAAKVMISQFNDQVHANNTNRQNGPDDEEEVLAISPLQVDLIPAILRPLCAVGMTLHDKVRQAATTIIADIIAIELQTCGELTRVQNVLISTIDLLVMSENKGDDMMTHRLVPELDRALETRLREQRSEDLVPEGHKIVESLGKFLQLLLQIRSLPMDNDEFMDDRISATLRLMEFIRVIQRQDIYVKYVHQLVELHVSNQNYVEAALTLRFHADLLDWDPHRTLEPILELNVPAQTAFARKEALYRTMATYLEKGQAWEICIKVLKELASHYETTVYDYTKLSEVLQRQAQLTQDIIKKERYFTEYFRVAFYGRGFPIGIRNQQFIYRGLEWEKLTSFVERMQSRHPNAQLLSSKYSVQSNLTDEQLRELDAGVDAQYLHITTVVPEPPQSDVLRNELVPENVRKYYKFNEVSQFSCSRPFDKPSAVGQPPDADKPEMDFLNLWTRKTIFVTEQSFPTTARRSKVVTTQDIEISPIENAVLAMENKTQELKELNHKYAALIQNRRSSEPVNISPFSMALNGAVDAPVNGGVALYRKAFLTDWYWEKHPEMRSWVRELKTVIKDQVDTIEHCLETHKKLVSSDMRPFHQTLVGFFKKNFKKEIDQLHKLRDTQQQQQQEQQQQPSEDNPVPAQPAVDAGRRPSLARQNSAAFPSSLPLSPMLTSMRSPSGDGSRPPTLLMENLEESATAPTTPVSSTPSRAESISRSLKMSLRKKKRNTTNV